MGRDKNERETIYLTIYLFNFLVDFKIKCTYSLFKLVVLRKKIISK